MQHKHLIAPVADGLRGLACLIVLIMHATSAVFPSFSVRGAGGIGVQLFFVLSSYLLTQKLLCSGFGRQAMSEYITGRCFRILPPYLVAILFYKVVGIAILSWQDAYLAFFMQASYIHLWSVPVEFKYYLILPFVVFGFIQTQQNYGNIGTLFFLFLISSTCLIMYPFWPVPFLWGGSTNPLVYAPSFFFGSTAALLQEETALIPQKIQTYISNVIVCAFFIRIPGIWKFLSHQPPDTIGQEYIYMGGGWAIFIWLNMHGISFWGKLLSSQWIRTIGVWSFSTYLFHWYYLSKIPFFVSGVLAWCFIIVASIFTGAFSFYTIEKLSHHARNRFQQYIDKKQSVAQQYIEQGETRTNEHY